MFIVVKRVATLTLYTHFTWEHPSIDIDNIDVPKRWEQCNQISKYMVYDLGTSKQDPCDCSMLLLYI